MVRGGRVARGGTVRGSGGGGRPDETVLICLRWAYRSKREEGAEGGGKGEDQ